MRSVLKERVVRVALEARHVERGPVVLVERSLQLETLQEVRVGERPATIGDLQKRATSASMCPVLMPMPGIPSAHCGQLALACSRLLHHIL